MRNNLSEILPTFQVGSICHIIQVVQWLYTSDIPDPTFGWGIWVGSLGKGKFPNQVDLQFLQM